MSNTEKAECLCGSLRCEFDRDQVTSAHHCHCTDCQKSTGSGKATIVVLPTEALSIEGVVKTYTVKGSAGSHIKRGFCPNCGSPVVSFIEEKPGIRLIKVGALNDSSWVKIDSNFWSDSAAHWSPVDNSVASSEKNPPPGTIGG